TDGAPIFRPALGYRWVDNADPDNFAIKVRPDLRVAKYGIDGIAVSFFPAPGFIWDGNPNMLETTLQEGLLVNGDGIFRPSLGYMWVDPEDSTNLAVIRNPALLKQPNGVFTPAPGYEWVDSHDPKNWSVRQIGFSSSPHDHDTIEPRHSEFG